MYSSFVVFPPLCSWPFVRYDVLKLSFLFRFNGTEGKFVTHPFFILNGTHVDSAVTGAVQTEKTGAKIAQKKKQFSVSDALTRGQRPRTRRGNRTRVTQVRQERNQAVLSNATWPTFHGERAVTDKVSHQKQGRACEYFGRDAREQRESHEPISADGEQHSGRSGSQGDTPSLPTLAVRSVQNAVFFGHHFMHGLGCVQRWHVARLALAERSGESRE